MLTSTVWLTVLGLCCAGSQDSTLYALLGKALGAVPGAPLTVDSIRPSAWPEAMIYRARRIPPFPHGEDPRPAIVSAVVIGVDTIITHDWEHLPRLWGAFGYRPQDPDSTRSVLMQLLDLSSIAPGSRIIHSPTGAESAGVAWTPADRAALKEVREPSVQTFGPGTLVTIYTRERGGVFVVKVLITQGGVLEYSRDRIAATVLNH